MHCAPGGVEESDVGLLLKRRYEITGQCEFGLGLTACRSARPETLEMEGSVCYRSVFGSTVPWLQLQNSWRGFGNGRQRCCLANLSCRVLIRALRQNTFQNTHGGERMEGGEASEECWSREVCVCK